MRRQLGTGATGRTDDSETFRRLVRKEITADDYVKSLEKRVRESQEATETEQRESDQAASD